MSRTPTAKPVAHRPQVAALPIRRSAHGCEVMLITSRETRRWIVPKGWPMKGLKDHQAAAREALEEAGIKGKVHRHPIGAYTYEKRVDDRVEPCRVMVYRLDVDEERSKWPEAEQRTRRWFSAREAAQRVSEPGLASLILSLGRPQVALASAEAELHSAGPQFGRRCLDATVA